MHESLQDAIDAGLGNVRALVDGLKRDGSLLTFEQFQNVERFGEDWDEVKPLDLLLGQIETLLQKSLV
jgi:hypothetical protein